MNRTRGFTLLETVVAMAILALSLMAIFDLNAGAIATHTYTKKLTVATLLSRSKMTDLEQNLFDKGFSNDDEEEGGDFSDEGWPSFKWRAKIIAPKTDGLSPEQVMGALFNIPMGKEGAGDPLAGLFGGGGAAGAAAGAAGAAGGAGGAMAMLGPMAGMAQAQFTQMLSQISKTVREVHLTVSWKDGKRTESIDLVTHVVSSGPGSDRNGGGTGTATPPMGGGDPKSLVNANTGMLVPSPKIASDGSMTDPADGAPVITMLQYQMAHGQGGQVPGGQIPGGQIFPKIFSGGSTGNVLLQQPFQGPFNSPRPLRTP